MRPVHTRGSAHQDLGLEHSVLPAPVACLAARARPGAIVLPRSRGPTSGKELYNGFNKGRESADLSDGDSSAKIVLGEQMTWFWRWEGFVMPN